MNLAGPSLLAFFAFSALATAQSPVGRWKGNLGVRTPTIPHASAKTQAQMKEAMSPFAALALNLVLKADHTYSMEVTGGPRNMGHESSKDAGVWNQAGRTLSFTSKKKVGTNAQRPVLSAKISSDGKTLTLTSQHPGQGRASIVFKRV